MERVTPKRKPRARLTAAQRATRDKRRSQKHAAHIKCEYGITIEEYAAIKEAQGGKCYICQRATGKTKKLAVDHDHQVERLLLSLGLDSKLARRRSVRGLLCYTCNRMLAHGRDEPRFFIRATHYLDYPPAGEVLGNDQKRDQRHDRNHV